MNARLRTLLIVGAVIVAGTSAAVAEPIAIGIAPSAHLLRTNDWGVVPELLAHTYAPVGAQEHRLFLRPGARLSVRGLVQDDMASDLRIEERDVAAFAELGLVRGGRVVPSATILAGVARRWITLDASGVDTSMSRAGGDEWLPIIGGQLGVGLPLHRRVMVEPFVRYELVIDDSRTHLRWGVEASISFGN